MADPDTRRGLRTLAATLPKIAGPAARRRGFTEIDVITRWSDVVGATLARASAPERLSFRRGARSDGTLHLRVAGGAATELLHLEPLVIERINRFFGYRAVARIAMVQGPVEPPAAPSRAALVETQPETAPDPDPELEAIADESLRAALTRLKRALRRHHGLS